MSVGSYRSAQVLVPIVVDLLRPTSVVDFGCGTGMWLRAFADLGITDFLGVDAGEPPLAIPADRFMSLDLQRAVTLGGTFDLAISLEVGEHLPAESAADFVVVIASHSDAVVFSAAIPGQRGFAHLNEQWPQYWAALFSAKSFGNARNGTCSGPVSERS